MVVVPIIVSLKTLTMDLSFNSELQNKSKEKTNGLAHFWVIRKTPYLKSGTLQDNEFSGNF
tara:strand:- start:92 stop:274 length:183 start_codon:yes stop_codon:yes gene_type:complete